MNQNVKDCVQTCVICKERKQPPRYYIVSDIAGPFPVTQRENQYILIIEDYFTEVYSLTDMNAETVANVFLRGWIKRYGCPVEIHSDQGTQYESTFFKEYATS